MSPIFGDPQKFAIEYTLLEENEEYEHRKFLASTSSELRVWVEGHDLCEYEYEGEVHKYNWHLYYLIDWFCDNLDEILGYDPYPLPINGDNLIEIFDSYIEIEIEDELQMSLWYSANQKWRSRHNLSENNDESRLSEVYFRRERDTMEVAWDNRHWKDWGVNVEFVNKKGVYYLPVSEFTEVILNFITSIVNDIEAKFGYHTTLEEWKKTIRMYKF